MFTKTLLYTDVAARFTNSDTLLNAAICLRGSDDPMLSNQNIIFFISIFIIKNIFKNQFNIL